MNDDPVLLVHLRGDLHRLNASDLIAIPSRISITAALAGSPRSVLLATTAFGLCLKLCLTVYWQAVAVYAQVVVD